MGLSLQQAVFSLKKLQRLHIRGLRLDDDDNLNDPRPMKEIVYYTDIESASVLINTILYSGSVLEVLVLNAYGVLIGAIDIRLRDPKSIPLLGGREGAPTKPLSHVPHLSALTHLDLSVPLTDPSLKYLSTILPRLNLVHFGCNKDSHGLLPLCNLASLKSLSIVDPSHIDLQLLQDTMGDGTAGPTWDGLEQLYIGGTGFFAKVPAQFLQSTRLTRLYLDDIGSTLLKEVLEDVNLSKLQEISICKCWYYGSPEQALAKRVNEFTESLLIRLDEFSSNQYIDEWGGPRTFVPLTLPRHRVTNSGLVRSEEHHYRFLQHVLPVYSF